MPDGRARPRSPATRTHPSLPGHTTAPGADLPSYAIGNRQTSAAAKSGESCACHCVTGLER
eukprot:4854479-Alexandrium_andersonii.AAC.1